MENYKTIITDWIKAINIKQSEIRKFPIYNLKDNCEANCEVTVRLTRKIPATESNASKVRTK